MGIIFNIQKFCIHDGDGIRTCVFLKGCPLRCIWCHNAEGLQGGRQLAFNANQCLNCGECSSMCPSGCHGVSQGIHSLDASSCTYCGKCADNCPTEAVRIVGRTISVQEVMREIIADRPFYKNSGGGVTLSGGEPFMQAGFAQAIAEECKKEGITLCIETCGYCKEEDILRLAPYTEMFLFDFKHYSPEKHKEYTGVDNGVILNNLRLLQTLGKPVILRCPIIPDCNDAVDHYESIAKLANEMNNIVEIHIEPYHPLGVDKYSTLGMTAGYSRSDIMPTEDAERIVDTLRSMTDTPVKIS